MTAPHEVAIGGYIEVVDELFGMWSDVACESGRQEPKRHSP